MATIPTPDDTARALLAIMTEDLSWRAGEAVSRGPLRAWIQKRGIDFDDIDPGLNRMVELGWLEYNEARKFHYLTAAAFAPSSLRNPPPTLRRQRIYNRWHNRLRHPFSTSITVMSTTLNR
jgi:hypothetical protein